MGLHKRPGTGTFANILRTSPPGNSNQQNSTERDRRQDRMEASSYGDDEPSSPSSVSDEITAEDQQTADEAEQIKAEAELEKTVKSSSNKKALAAAAIASGVLVIALLGADLVATAEGNKIVLGQNGDLKSHLISDASKDMGLGSGMKYGHAYGAVLLAVVVAAVVAAVYVWQKNKSANSDDVDFSKLPQKEQENAVPNSPTMCLSPSQEE